MPLLAAVAHGVAWATLVVVAAVPSSAPHDPCYQSEALPIGCRRRHAEPGLWAYGRSTSVSARARLSLLKTDDASLRSLSLVKLEKRVVKAVSAGDQEVGATSSASSTCVTPQHAPCTPLTLHWARLPVRSQATMAAFGAYQQKLNSRLESIPVSKGLQLALGLVEEPRSMTDVLGLWLDGYKDVDSFYRGQETVVEATAAGYAQAAIPLRRVFERFAEVLKQADAVEFSVYLQFM
eukprot:SAG31_NODE_4526_length_3164_cov_1.693312_2_plen_236_part_00